MFATSALAFRNDILYTTGILVLSNDKMARIQRMKYDSNWECKCHCRHYIWGLRILQTCIQKFKIETQRERKRKRQTGKVAEDAKCLSFRTFGLFGTLVQYRTDAVIKLLGKLKYFGTKSFNDATSRSLLPAVHTARTRQYDHEKYFQVQVLNRDNLGF